MHQTTLCKLKKNWVAIIPATQEEDIRRITVRGDPGQKVSKTPPQLISREWWYTPLIPATQVGGSEWDWPWAKVQDISWKITETKKG
jgi:hypothetical protein